MTLTINGNEAVGGSTVAIKIVVEHRAVQLAENVGGDVDALVEVSVSSGIPS